MTASVEFLLKTRLELEAEGGLFYALKSYLIRKVSRSITIAMIAMTSIAFSYFVTDDLLHLIT